MKTVTAHGCQWRWPVFGTLIRRCATCDRCRRGSACRYDCLCFLVVLCYHLSVHPSVPYNKFLTQEWKITAVTGPRGTSNWRGYFGLKVKVKVQGQGQSLGYMKSVCVNLYHFPRFIDVSEWVSVTTVDGKNERQVRTGPCSPTMHHSLFNLPITHCSAVSVSLVRPALLAPDLLRSAAFTAQRT